MKKSTKKLISVISPFYNEEHSVKPFCENLLAELNLIKKFDFEIILIDDGSDDKTFENLLKFTKKFRNIKILKFTRNYGKEAALTAGLDHLSCNSEAAIFLDSDLQHPPKYIHDLICEWKKGFKIVSFIRNSVIRKGIFREVGSYFFYFLLKFISSVKFVKNSTDYRIIDKVVIDYIKFSSEKPRVFRGLIDWPGFETKYLYFDAPARFIGKQSYSLSKLFSLAINHLISYSYLPLKFIFIVGLIITLFSSIIILWFLIDFFLALGNGFTSLAYFTVLNTFLMGFIILSIGLVALYVINIHTEVGNRPIYVVDKKINFDT